jgi:hypothetical protein
MPRMLRTGNQSAAVRDIPLDCVSASVQNLSQNVRQIIGRGVDIATYARGKLTVPTHRPDGGRDCRKASRGDCGQARLRPVHAIAGFWCIQGRG